MISWFVNAGYNIYFRKHIYKLDTLKLRTSVSHKTPPQKMSKKRKPVGKKSTYICGYSCTHIYICKYVYI